MPMIEHANYGVDDYLEGMWHTNGEPMKASDLLEQLYEANEDMMIGDPDMIEFGNFDMIDDHLDLDFYEEDYLQHNQARFEEDTIEHLRDDIQDFLSFAPVEDLIRLIAEEL